MLKENSQFVKRNKYMKELVKIENKEINNESVQTVSARELYKFLEVTERFSSWIQRQFQYGFEENKDYLGCKVFNTLANQELDDFILTLDTAKEVSMLQKSSKGREARRYFIECEKKQAEALNSLARISYNHPENLIFSIAGEVYTTSQALATVSNKQHFHVLRDINEEIRALEMDPNLDPLIKDKLLKGFKRTEYLDKRNRLKTSYDLSEEAFLQMSLRYSAEIRAKFIVAFTSYRDALIDMYKARALEKVLPQLNSSRSFVYVIREEGKGRFKIGVSNNPEKRLKQLQTGSPEDLTLVYTSLVCSNAFDLESQVHEHFKNYLLRGEWFDTSLELKEVILFLESKKYVLESDFDLSFGSKLLDMINTKKKV